jgi:predicted secreted protein with PEFG-CTERM motif
MNIKAISSILVLFALVVGVAATTPTAYADHMTADVSINPGSSVPGCETTNECFTPYQVTIDPGGEVTWTNDDTAAHTVTSGTAKDGPDGNFDSSLFMAGTTFSVKFDGYDAGTYPYFCMVHPWMTGEVIVEEAGATHTGEEELMVEIETGSAAKGESMQIDVSFLYADGDNAQHVNYNIKATQNGQVVLNDMGAHEHEGQGTHMTDPLPFAASTTNPVDVQVEFLGYGIDKPFTGPIGQIATKQAVPEFGTIAMMILGISIVSIIAVTTKTRVIPRL